MSCLYILPENGLGIALTVNSNDYFVGKDFADRVGWGIVLMLMGDEPNKIASNEYVKRHIMYDTIYLAVIIISVLPLFRLGKYKKSIAKGSFAANLSRLLILHLVLPAFLLMLSRIFFHTPLWVVRAFVPDMFITIIVAAFFLFTGGIIKGFLMIRDK